MNEDIKNLAKDIIEDPDVIWQQVDKDLEAVSDILWKTQKCIDSHLEATKKRKELYKVHEDD